MLNMCEIFLVLGAIVIGRFRFRCCTSRLFLRKAVLTHDSCCLWKKLIAFSGHLV